MKIRSRTATLFASLLAASIVALGLPGTLIFLKHREGELGGCLIAFAAPFILAGVGLALWALRELVQMVRYGTWELECADGGGAAGEALPVRIRPGRLIEPTGLVKLTLRCVEATTYRATAGHRGSESRTESKVLKAVESTVATGPLVDPRHGFAATIEVPAGLPGSTADREAARAVTWQLVVEVPGRRGDAHVSFELPVRGASGILEHAFGFDPGGAASG